MPRTRIKVCGIRTLDAAMAAVDSGADAIGFVFIRSSARAIEPENAADIMWSLPPMVTTVGVFMNASVDTFADIEELCPTHYAQLHGSEDEATVKACGPAIKTVRFAHAALRQEMERWAALDEVDAILIDAVGVGGADPDWKAISSAAAGLRTPVILSGDLTPANVAAAVRIVQPYSVDVSAGVERERGVKDPELIDAFCAAVRAADRG